jgi:hypothetical protein
MKRFLPVFIALLLTASFSAYAQHYNPEALDREHQVQTGNAAMLTLVAEKYVMELDELNTATVRINWVNPGDETNVPQQYDYHFDNPAQAPWKITKWEILEGGGEITEGPGQYYASYKSPAVMPSGKHATISVTMEPVDPSKPKVQLLQTIYFVDNDNVFYLNFPAYGINQEKYVIKNSNSGLVAASSTNSQQAMQYGSDAQKAKLAALQAQLAATNQMARNAMAAQNVDADLITSNAKAMYTKDKDFTAVELKGDDVTMVNGVAVTKKRSYMISISFPGQKTGSYIIKSKDIIAVSVALPGDREACTCAYDPSRDQSHAPPCRGGTITITKYDTHVGGYVEGYVNANVMGSNGQVVFGDISGKFKVKLAKTE